MRYLLLIGIFLFAGLGLANDCKDQAARIAANVIKAQNAAGNPVGLWAYRLVFNQGEIPYLEIGEPYTLMKTFDGGFYSPGPLKVPQFNFNNSRIYELTYAAVLEAQLLRYESDKGFSKQLTETIKALFRLEVQSPSSRNILYRIHNVVNANESGSATAHIRMHDGTKIDGQEALHPLEILTNWQVPEREQEKKVGLLELGFAFNNHDPILKPLGGFQSVLREIATYIDVRFLAHDTPCIVRAIVDTAGKELFTSRRHPYQFEVEKKFDSFDPPLWVIKIDGQTFVERFQTDPKWRHWSKGLSNNPDWSLVDPLHSPKQYHEVVRGLMRGVASDFIQYVQVQREGLPGMVPMIQFRLDNLPPDLLNGTNSPEWIERLHQGRPLSAEELPEFQVFRWFVENQTRFLPRLLF